MQYEQHARHGYPTAADTADTSNGENGKTAPAKRGMSTQCKRDRSKRFRVELFQLLWNMYHALNWYFECKNEVTPVTCME